ncbi:type II toxin-antitoxin system PemK/MazF family toxin [Candidatus Wolfebacteria bacterium]|nr:type II toxin-antitoxin system PemK/MazF family toxin [Candidatus Wolfebacteria bacterium]
MRKGDIVLVNFPFADFDNSKLRPAVVLIPENDYGDVCLCFITSKILREKDSIIIDENDNNFQRTGLKVDSTIRVGKIVTLEKKIIVGKIGSIPITHIKTLNKILKEIFYL